LGELLGLCKLAFDWRRESFNDEEGAEGEVMSLLTASPASFVK
jgi:hypothetical protein